MKGNKELVKLLIAKGADIHTMDKYKWAAFHGPNVSTTPITAMGCRQCLPLSAV